MQIVSPDTGTFKIASDRLSVELAYPGSAVQKGARFDLSGHVVGVVLDGKHTFCAPEAMDDLRGSGGIGICNEFQDVAQAMYQSAAPGGQFPKFGVGLVTRGDGDYSFMTHYDKHPYPIEVSTDGRTAVFRVQPVDCMGWSARIEKQLTVSNNTLMIMTMLGNTGSKPLNLREYNHNFVCVDRHPVGPDYRLSLPYVPELETVPDILSIDGRGFTWKGVPQGPFFCLPKGYEGAAPHWWELVHVPTGVGMRETDNFPVEHLALWGVSHVVSMEAFIAIELAPGRSMGWTRTYEFFAR